jgi:hypothetical protein
VFGTGKACVKPIQNCDQTIGFAKATIKYFWCFMEKESKLNIIVLYKVVKITFGNPSAYFNSSLKLTRNKYK